MPSLKIDYSVDFEILRIQNTLKKYAWYKERQYLVALPPALDVNMSLDDNMISELVRADYAEDDYGIQKEYIVEHWKNLVIGINEDLHKIFPEMLDSYIVQLTRYGVGGSYYPPNTIILNIQFRRNEEGLKSVFHEMIHLAIQPLIEKFNIEHWTKERLVDLLTSRLNPLYGRYQKLPISSDDIDRIFNAQYPNVEGIIKALGKESAPNH